MGLFTQSTMTIDETVDVTTFVTAMSIAHYLRRGSLLSAGQRRQMLDHRLAERGKDASWWHKSKLCVTGDEVARLLVSDGEFVQMLEEKGWGVSTPLPSVAREINETIASVVRKILFTKRIV